MSRGTEPQTTPVAPNPKSTPKETDAEATSTVARGEEVATDGAADDSLVPQYQERLFRIYQEHEPVMRAYKRAISICVHEDEHDFTLQRIPGNPKDIQYKTTCGHMYCKSANGVFEPHTYRVSIERKQNADPQKPLDGAIPLEPLHKWSSTLAKWPGSIEKRGKGKNVKHWLCLECLEDLWMEASGFSEDANDAYELPKIHDLALLKPEWRKQGSKDYAYHLSSPQIYALEKWCAVMRFDHPYIDWAAAGCISGLEPETLYLDTQTRNLRGVDEITGSIVEVSAAQVKGKFLSDVLASVDRAVEQARYDYEAKDNGVQDTSEDGVATLVNAGAEVEDVEMENAPSPAETVEESVPDVRRNPRRKRNPTRKFAENV